jgi:hypothetical protein
MFTHCPPHIENPLAHDAVQVVPEQVSVAWLDALQVAHVPSQQMLPVPHEVSSAPLPVATHVAVPVLQEIAPVSHGFPSGTQAMPGVHGSHAPLRQTSFVPHGVPSGAVAVGTQLA